MKHTACVHIALALVGALSGPLRAEAQSVLQRTPNLSGGWVGENGTVYFNFLHRFYKLDVASGEDRILNTPTFLLSYPFAELFMLGVHYSSNSRTVERNPNEWELFFRFAPLKPGAGLPVELALTGAYNEAAGSWDGEAALGVPAGRATFMGALRGFSDAFGGDSARLALGAGLRLRISQNVALAGDFVTPASKRDEEQYGWSAALQLGIPSTPHTLSLHASNTSTATLQGSSRRAEFGPNPHSTRYGFEFTVPLTLSRFFGGGAARGDVTITADTARVAIRDFEFGVQRLVIQPGTTVVWVNEGNTPHTTTSDSDLWGSPLLATGESYSRVFDAPGEYAYHCQPHPFMTATIVVEPAG